MTGPVRSEPLHGGTVERLWLARPKANVLDRVMIAALDGHFQALGERRARSQELKAVVLSAEGPHFSFGASVPEHAPLTVGSMLPAFHRMIVNLEQIGVPTIATVRGQCLGGGAELAAACGTVLCDRTVQIGVPEIRLGMFPPVAAATWPLRMGLGHATDLVLTGRVVEAIEARAIGLVDHTVDDVEAGLAAWLDAHVLPRSAVALHHAWVAVRGPQRAALSTSLADAEHLYLDSLMRHRDPAEGVAAWLEKREPVWGNP